MTHHELLQKVELRHRAAEAIAEEYNYGTVIFTSLVGSQNYGLETENSDIDTCSFILPDYMNFIRGLKPINKEVEFDNGKIVIKDLREAFELLRKPSPNSIEWFVSQYMVSNENFTEILQEKMMRPYYLIHANYQNMQDALIGTARGLHGRNMSLGKKYAHLLRLKNLAMLYFNNTIDETDFLSIRSFSLLDALRAKKGELIITEEDYNKKLEEVIAYISSFPVNTQDEKVIEYLSQHTINRLQYKIFEKYLELVT